MESSHSFQSDSQEQDAITVSEVLTDITQPTRSESPNSSDCVNNTDEMRGFKVFLIIAQSACFIVLLGAVTLSWFVSSTALTPLAVYASLELFVLIIAVIHALKPSMRFLVVFLLLSVGISISAIVLALVVTVKDEGKDCTRDKCSTFNFSSVERFRFFWFLLTKATFSLFLSLVVVAYSPQVHDFLADDGDYERATFTSGSSFN